jgi:hypothetical protein
MFKGKNNPMYGKENRWGTHTKKAKKQIGLAKRDEKSWNWKGDKAGYTSIHYWVHRRKPKPLGCEKCKKEKNRLELSNNSGKYLRDIKDYEWLCCSCHKYKDRGTKICPKCNVRNKYKNWSYCKECYNKYQQQRYSKLEVVK